MPKRVPLKPAFAAFAALTCVAGSPSAHGQYPPSGSQKSAEQLVPLRVMPDVTMISPGQPFNLVVEFVVEPGWHLYWKNPGAGAAPIELTVKVPEGFSAQPPRWPRPEVIPSELGDMYCYSGRVMLFVPVTALPMLTPQQAIFSVDAAWAVCDERKCLLGSALRMITVPATNLAGGAHPVADPAIVQARSRLARPLAEVEDATLTVRDGRLVVSGPAEGRDSLTFFPNPGPGVTYGKPVVSFEAGRFELTIPVSIDPNNLRGRKPVVAGLVALGEESDDPSLEFEASWERLSSESS